jgi:hypothetical protein
MLRTIFLIFTQAGREFDELILKLEFLISGLENGARQAGNSFRKKSL